MASPAFFAPTPPCPAPHRAAGEDKVSGKRITAATCTSSKVMGFLAQLLQTPYGDKVGSGRLSKGSGLRESPLARH